MDLKDILKFKLITQGSSIKQFLTFLVMEELTKHVGSFVKFFIEKQNSRANDTLKQILSLPLMEDAILLNKKHSLNTFNMKRIYQSETRKNIDSFAESNSMIDAILGVVARLNNVPTLRLIENAKLLTIYTDKPIQVTRDIFIKINEVKTGSSGLIELIDLDLVSNNESAAGIARWVRKVHEDYKIELRNALGDSLYFFDQKQGRNDTDPRGVPQSDQQEVKRLMIATAPKQLGFTQVPFYSNKTFKNIFGKEVREIEHRVRFFCENKDWYDSRGIPYQLGILLSGIPGSGKTSIIRAIANYTKRHIINVNFANISTATQLKNLFFDDNLKVFTDSTQVSTATINLPVSQRIYVLEELDAIGNIVHKRNQEHPIFTGSAIPDEITLAEILTVLDGTLETPGRIVIMTSNKPEILDEALIRPGRIDVAVKFGHADKQLIVEMYESFFTRKFPESLVCGIPDKKWTPAEVGQILFRHFQTTDPSRVLLELQQSKVDYTTPTKVISTPSSQFDPDPWVGGGGLRAASWDGPSEADEGHEEAPPYRDSSC
jgi:hypothetical protein